MENEVLEQAQEAVETAVAEHVASKQNWLGLAGAGAAVVGVSLGVKYAWKRWLKPGIAKIKTKRAEKRKSKPIEADGDVWDADMIIDDEEKN